MHGGDSKRHRGRSQLEHTAHRSNREDGYRDMRYGDAKKRLHPDDRTALLFQAMCAACAQANLRSEPSCDRSLSQQAGTYRHFSPPLFSHVDAML